MNTTAFKDRKKYWWLHSVMVPSMACIGTMAHYFFGAEHQAWFFAPLVLFYVVAPVRDAFVGEDNTNPPESAVPELINDPYYRRILYATIPVLVLALWFNLFYLANHDLPLASWLATVIATGSVLGFGLNVSHELGHKREPWAKRAALFVAALGGYGHFSIEHNRGHHRHVATPEDPASAKMGESIYRFALRELPGGFTRAWALERRRLEINHLSAWHWRNEILQGLFITFVLAAAMVFSYGFDLIPAMILVAIWGAFQLTSANYVEHYGLLRLKDANGRYESCQPHHSWNSNHLISNLFIFHLQRHSDHHSHPGRPYQALRDFPDLPRLPSGYFGMFIVAYIPPLWFWLMNPRLVKAVKNDANKIHFLASAQARLLRQFNLTLSH